MIRPTMTAVAMCVLFALGCARPQMNQDAPAQNTESTVLRTACAETLAELVDLAKQEEGRVPPEVMEPDFIVRTTEMLKDKSPSLFMVSPTEEADFRAGRYHDDDNKKRMKQSLQELEDYDRDLPSVSAFLIHRLIDGTLEGAQLEFAARLLSAQADEARALAEGTDDEHAAPLDEE